MSEPSKKLSARFARGKRSGLAARRAARNRERKKRGGRRERHLLPAVLRRFRPDLLLDFRNELMDRLFALQDDALALIDLRETLFGGLPQIQFRFAHLLVFFQKTQSFTDDFAGVAIAPRGTLAFDKEVEMFGEIDVASRHDRLLSLP